MLNGHKTACPSCDKTLNELRISYLEYIELGAEERKILHEKLKNCH